MKLIRGWNINEITRRASVTEARPPPLYIYLRGILMGESCAGIARGIVRAADAKKKKKIGASMFIE